MEANDLAFAVAVFAIPNDTAGRFIVVCLDEDANERAAADAVARGYSFAGTISVADGDSHVQIEPGFAGAVSVAGINFAEMLGVRLQRHQLAMKHASKA